MQSTMDGEQLRRGMRQVPSAVTVVTAAAGGTMRGITIGSFTSVSLDPPLISFNVGREAQSHDLLVAAEHFAVHLLTDEQAHLSTHFANPDLTAAEQFGPVAHRLDPHGTPLLEGVLAVFICAHHAVYPAGDHSLLLGRVLRIDEDLEAGSAGSPLLYFDRGYRGVGEAVTETVLTPVKPGSNDAL